MDTDIRTCDECGRETNAGEWPDWVNGVCELCDPSVLDEPENVERVHPSQLAEEKQRVAHLRKQRN